MTSINLIKTIVDRFFADRCLRVADSLAFTTILAVVPIFTVMFSIVSTFPLFDRWIDEIENFVYQHFLPASSGIIREYLTSFRSNAQQLTLIGSIFIAITSAMLMATIEEAFNDIYRTSKNRNPFLRIFSYIVIVVLAPMLFAVVLIFLTQLLRATAGEFSKFAAVDEAIGVVVPLVIELVILLIVYRKVPNRFVTWRSALIGAAIAAVLLEIAKWGFALFVQYSVAYQVIYGALAALPIFLLWVYISWVTILIGAVVCAVLNESDEASEGVGLSIP